MTCQHYILVQKTLVEHFNRHRAKRFFFFLVRKCIIAKCITYVKNFHLMLHLPTYNPEVNGNRLILAKTDLTRWVGLDRVSILVDTRVGCAPLFVCLVQAETKFEHSILQGLVHLHLYLLH